MLPHNITSFVCLTFEMNLRYDQLNKLAWLNNGMNIYRYHFIKHKISCVLWLTLWMIGRWDLFLLCGFDMNTFRMSLLVSNKCKENTSFFVQIMGKVNFISILYLKNNLRKGYYFFITFGNYY